MQSIPCKFKNILKTFWASDRKKKKKKKKKEKVSLSSNIRRSYNKKQSVGRGVHMPLKRTESGIE